MREKDSPNLIAGSDQARIWVRVPVAFWIIVAALPAGRAAPAASAS